MVLVSLLDWKDLITSKLKFDNKVGIFKLSIFQNTCYVIEHDDDSWKSR
jgi:hypothetical protein